MPQSPEPIDIAPVQDDGVAASLVGLVLWAVAAVGCLVAADRLADRGDEWWVWTCVAGMGIGLLMLVFTRRRARAYRAARAAGPTAPDAG